MKTLWIFIVVLLIVTMQADSEARLPNAKQYTPQFGFGARVAPTGLQNYQAAARAGLDWVSLDFPWDEAHSNPIIWETLETMQSLDLNILLSVTQPPNRVVSESGPSPLATAQLLNGILRRFPNIRAIELYPAANTRRGWGASPNPGAYRELFEFTEQYLAAQGYNVLLVAGGLANQGLEPGDIPDIHFLHSSYQAGLRPKIIGLRFSEPSPNLLEAPAPTALLHIEQIRAVTQQNKHDAQLWITGLELPAAYARANHETQAAWLEQVFHLLRARLYIGNLFYTTLNPCAACQPSLVGSAGQPHPFLLRLQAGFPARPSEPGMRSNAPFEVHLSPEALLPGNQCHGLSR